MQSYTFLKNRNMKRHDAFDNQIQTCRNVFRSKELKITLKTQETRR